MTSCYTNKPPENATLERQRVDHKPFRSKRRREREEGGDLEFGQWHATARLKIRRNRNKVNASYFWPYLLLLWAFLSFIVFVGVLFYTDHLWSSIETDSGHRDPGDVGAYEEGSYGILKPGCGVLGWIAGCYGKQNTGS
jgi:hypothetical protein